MYISITGKKDDKDVYINQSFRKDDGKSSSRIYKKLGKYNDLLKSFDGDKDKFLTWAKKQAEKETESYNQKKAKVIIGFSQDSLIPLDEEHSFSIGYLFLQSLCYQLSLDKISASIKNKYKFQFNLNDILSNLIYARILFPSSKLSSYEYCKTLLEQPKYNLQDIYRSLSIIAKESDYIQSELYKNSDFVQKRDKRVLYYDCTNYYFEIEEEEGLKKYGKSKEHRPNPIITMGLFMDTDGIPLAFDIFPGNQNEQTTLKPLETKIIKDFDCSEFIFCSDAGLGSIKNRYFNSILNRSYVITQPLRKMKKEDREIALNPSQFKKIGSNEFVDISKLDENDFKVFNSIYYKEIPVINSDMSETIIVSYSPRYKAYQRNIRGNQISRAKDILNSNDKKRKGKNLNDPMRFIKKTAVTKEGEIADKDIYELDSEKIKEEEQYDGYYAVITNLEGDIREILNINRRRWEIEESFRIMKTEFEARPVYVRRDDRIKAHFMTCFISLLIYRLLEKKLKNRYTTKEILTTLRNMRLTSLPENKGYIPSYKRTNLTDELHEIFQFRTDYELMTKATIKNIIKKSKKIN